MVLARLCALAWGEGKGGGKGDGEEVEKEDEDDEENKEDEEDEKDKEDENDENDKNDEKQKEREEGKHQHSPLQQTQVEFWRVLCHRLELALYFQCCLENLHQPPPGNEHSSRQFVSLHALDCEHDPLRMVAQHQLRLIPINQGRGQTNRKQH